MLLRFARFELDQQRAELRGPTGEAIKLRPKTFSILSLLATNPGRLVSKQELMDAVWPNVHVGDDSLFQCIRELRTALGDEQRQLIKLVSGRGYLLTSEVSAVTPQAAGEPAPEAVSIPVAAIAGPAGAGPQRLFGLSHRVEPAVTGVVAAAVFIIATVLLMSGGIFTQNPPTVAVMPFTVADGDAEAAAMAENVTTRLTDGLAKIENIRLTLPAASRTPQADCVVTGELHKSGQGWEGRARLTRAATGEVVWSEPVSIVTEGTDVALQQSRLAASIGHALAVAINTKLNDKARSASPLGLPPGSAKVAIEQATASIVQTSRERFSAAQTLLEKSLAEDPDNVDLAVTLAALQLRGIQMVWYSAADSAVAERKSRSVLEHALRVAPNSIPVLEAYCRFLNTTNEFVESLVACARTLNFDPWDGMALYHIGLAQLQQGRFEDALATFKQANAFDTPQVSRWTWRLGAGWACMLMNRAEEALPWILSSIAITPASGRSYMLLSAAYEDLGRLDEAKAAMEKGLALRPGSNAINVLIPQKNASSTFVTANDRLIKAFVAAGLPQG
jgi:DNA-binding winged helix-turn-helix (wHTH) protein/Tfp pilus assembly protein PilF/TolB-like protein